MKDAMHRPSIYPERDRWQVENKFRPWYGTVNMECDRPPVTGCGWTGIGRRRRESDDQTRLWDAGIWATLDWTKDGLVALVSRARYTGAEQAKIFTVLGALIPVKVV